MHVHLSVSQLISVANTAVSLRNWATLNSHALGQKNCWVGGLNLDYFSFVYPWSSFFFKFDNFLSIQGVCEPFQCPRTFFLSNLRIETSWRAINIDYPLHAAVHNVINFSAQFGGFHYFKAEKHPNSGITCR